MTLTEAHNLFDVVLPRTHSYCISWRYSSANATVSSAEWSISVFPGIKEKCDRYIGPTLAEAVRRVCSVYQSNLAEAEASLTGIE